MYELSEQNNLDNEKSNVKSLSKFLIEAFEEKLNVKLTKIFIVEASNLLRQIKSVYKYNDVI